MKAVGAQGVVCPGGQVYVWGIHPVMELLRLNPEKCTGIFVLPSFGRKKNQTSLISHAERCSVKIKRTDSFNSILPQGTVHQGVVAMTWPFWDIDFQEIPSLFEDNVPLMLICDSVSDPHNLGAIIRNAVAFGAGCIILAEKNSSPVTGTVAKSSAGSLFQIRVCRVKNLARAMKKLKEKGIWIAGLAADGEKGIDEIDMTLPIALVAGSEHSGLRPVVKRECDMLVKIPMTGVLDSLNVASATAVALYESKRQRIKLA